METLGKPSREGRGERFHDPVRPYVISTASLPAHAPARHRRPAGAAGAAGRHRTLIAVKRRWSLTLAVYRASLAIGAAMVIAGVAGGVLLLFLPNHSATVLASQCRSNGCHQAVSQAPGTASQAPVTVLPSRASAYLTVPAALPSAGRAATVAAARGRAAGPSVAAAPFVTSTPAPSAPARTTRSSCGSPDASSPQPPAQRARCASGSAGVSPDAYLMRAASS